MMDGFDDDDDVYRPAQQEGGVIQPSSRVYLIQRADLPIDWSLKASISFEADFPLAWTKTVSPQILNFNGTSEHNAQINHYNYASIWTNALDHYCFGQSSTFPTLRNWKNAFRSLYYSCRLGACDVFYVKGPEFTIMFRCEQNPIAATISPFADTDQAISYNCIAFISHATRSFRDKLRQSYVEVSRLLEEEEEEDDEDNMFLEIKDHLNVNGLYEVVLDHFEGAQRDLPLLLSRQPFLNAVVSRGVVNLHLTSNTSRLEVSVDHGSILPSAAKELCDALAMAAKCNTADTGVRSAFKANFKYTGSHVFPNEFVEAEDSEDVEVREFVSPIRVIKYDTSNGVFSVFSNEHQRF